jgi:hypothetical protein
MKLTKEEAAKELNNLRLAADPTPNNERLISSLELAIKILTPSPKRKRS